MGEAGRLLVGVYAVFAVAAGARSVVQLATTLHVAPFAYLLSLGSALVYLVATVALRRPGQRARLVAVLACTIELVGVLVVGALSVAHSDLFPDQTVWSGFGAGYGYVPLGLPLLGLLWLWLTRPLPG